MRPGALLIHGLASTPQLLGGVRAALESAGVEAVAPLLAGHGTTLEDFERSAWPDWVAEVEAAHAGLAAPGRPVVVVGHSTGGALACRLAADHPGVAGLVAVNPFVDPPAPSFRDILRQVRDQGHRCVPLQWRDAADPDARHEGAYEELPVPTLLSVCDGLDALRPDLGAIACPTLVITSRTDHVVPTESSDLLAESVPAPVERVWLERSWHLAPVDHDRAEVAERIVAFVRRVTAPPPA